MRFLVCSIKLVILLWLAISSCGAAEVPEVRILFYTPADVESPEGVVDRLTEVADYTEWFLVSWMKEWDYPPAREKIFQRRSDGKVNVLFVQSAETVESGKFILGPMETGRAARKLAQTKYEITAQNELWWVWVYIGDLPTRFSEYRGTGSIRWGGLSENNYTNIEGSLPHESFRQNDFAEKFTFKGCLHEFGHALGLPHNGPLVKRDLGIPLMGATLANYRRRLKNRENRMYLTEASAAMLWKHPVFTGVAEQRNLIPEVTWENVKVENDLKKRIAYITGRVESNLPIHSVIVYDSIPKIQETYFQKPYVARTEDDGTFRITISEPLPQQVTGEFKFLACGENGESTGDGKTRGIGSSHIIKYRTTRQGFELIE